MGYKISNVYDYVNFISNTNYKFSKYSEDSHNATSLNATFRIMQLTVIATNLVHQSLIATFKNYIS